MALLHCIQPWENCSQRCFWPLTKDVPYGHFRPTRCFLFGVSDTVRESARLVVEEIYSLWCSLIKLDMELLNSTTMSASARVHIISIPDSSGCYGFYKAPVSFRKLVCLTYLKLLLCAPNHSILKGIQPHLRPTQIPTQYSKHSVVEESTEKERKTAHLKWQRREEGAKMQFRDRLTLSCMLLNHILQKPFCIPNFLYQTLDSLYPNSRIFLSKTE